jgi:hypothetical protein
VSIGFRDLPSLNFPESVAGRNRQRNGTGQTGLTLRFVVGGARWIGKATARPLQADLLEMLYTRRAAELSCLTDMKKGAGLL